MDKCEQTNASELQAEVNHLRARIVELEESVRLITILLERMHQHPEA